MSLLSNVVKSITGSSITGLVQQAAPLAASYFGGPVAGSAASILTGGGFNGSRTVPDYGPVMPGGAPVFGATRTALPMIGGILRGGASLLGLGAGLGGAALRAGAGVLRTAAGAIRGVVLSSGKFLSSSKAAALARRVGIDAAAAALGIGAVELAEMIMADQQRRARRSSRGISGRDMRTAKRTIKRVERLHREIVHACSSAHVPARRAFGKPRTIVQQCLPAPRR